MLRDRGPRAHGRGDEGRSEQRARRRLAGQPNHFRHGRTTRERGVQCVRVARTGDSVTIQFTKAARHAVKLKIGIDGPSGSGKTLGALALAHGITQGGRIAVADSENGSASLYADRYEFDTVAIPDANPETYKSI